MAKKTVQDGQVQTAYLSIKTFKAETGFLYKHPLCSHDVLCSEMKVENWGEINLGGN